MQETEFEPTIGRIVTARAAARPKTLLKAIAGLPKKKIRKSDLVTLMGIAKQARPGPVSLMEKAMIGDAFATRNPTDKAAKYYQETLVRQYGFPKPEHVRDSIFGGP